jgi:hypothetical protein
MSSTLTGLLVFTCTFGAAILGILLRARLPAHHLDGDSKDSVKLVIGLIATMAALVLGLLISSAHTAYDAQEAEIQQLGVHLYQLDRILVHFGSQATEARARLRNLVAADIARTWPEEQTKAAPNAAREVRGQAELLFEQIASLSATTNFERFGQSHALELLGSIGQTRRLLSEQAQGSLSWFILAVLMAWLTLLFFGFGLFARFNATVVVAFIAGALSVATACLLILDMNQPYRGWMQMSSAPLREALREMDESRTGAASSRAASPAGDDRSERPNHPLS